MPALFRRSVIFADIKNVIVSIDAIVASRIGRFLKENPNYRPTGFDLEFMGRQFQVHLDVYKDYDYESTKKFFQKMVSDKRKAFLNGFLLEVAKKVQELALTDEETDNINAYLKKNYPQLRTYHKRNKAMSDQEVSAFSAGQNEGQKAQINTAINNHAPERKRLK